MWARSNAGFPGQAKCEGVSNISIMYLSNEGISLVLLNDEHFHCNSQLSLSPERDFAVPLPSPAQPSWCGLAFPAAQGQFAGQPCRVASGMAEGSIWPHKPCMTFLWFGSNGVKWFRCFGWAGTRRLFWQVPVHGTNGLTRR